MTPETRALLTPEVRDEVAATFGVAPDALEDLGGFESFVYRTTRDGAPAILKATWSGRRTPAQLGAEIHFVQHVAEGGGAACQALPMADGEMVGTVPAARDAFHVTAFVEAPGRILPRAEWDDAAFVRWGAMVGRMHRLAGTYAGPPESMSRPTWQEDLDEALQSAPAGPVREQIDRILAEVSALPVGRDVYGTIHTDLHHGNLHWTDDEIHVFDFDDMLACWFARDIAIVMFHACIAPIWHEGDRDADYRRAYAALRQGYETEHRLPDAAWADVGLFLRLREATIVSVILRSIPPSERIPFHVQYLEEATARIAAGAPGLGIEDP